MTQNSDNEPIKRKDAPLRILQISYDMNLGGAETLIMNLYRNIDRTKVQFDFLLHSDSKSAYDDEIASLGGKIYRIPRFLGYNRLSYDRTLTSFLIEHPEYMVIHDHLMDSATETFRVAKKLGRITVAHSHTVQNGFSASNIIRFFFRKDICRFADYRFACSEEAGKWLYRGKADFTVLRNGIEPSRFCFSREVRRKLRNELGITENETALVHVGRFSEEKNHMRLLNIFREVCTLNADSKLFLIGDGPLKSKIEREAGSSEIRNRVIFMGGCRNVNELLSAFDVFILPSLAEGLPISLVEAQASGLPCIFSDFITSEVRIIPSLLCPVSLGFPDGTWAEAVVSASPLDNRENGCALVRKAGFDIRETAEKLENFYLGISREAAR